MNMDQYEDEMFFTVCNDKGEDVKCELLFTFEDNVTGKNYIVYTDNTQDEDGNFRVYANRYDPDENALALLPVEEERIWTMIEQMLEELQDEEADDILGE